MLSPTRIGFGHKSVPWQEFGGDGVDALDIDIRIAADLELESGIAFGANAVGVGGQIEGAERADLALSDEAVVGLNRDNGAVEHHDRFAPRPFTRRFVERELDAVSLNPCDLHGLIGRLSLLAPERCQRLANVCIGKIRGGAEGHA